MKLSPFQFPIIPFLERPWWVKVQTLSPACIYYFGPFDSEKEAKLSQGGYIEDLTQEGAQGIAIEIKRIRPKRLTIYNYD